MNIQPFITLALKFLDIRYGRANRGQYLAVLITVIAAFHFICTFSELGNGWILLLWLLAYIELAFTFRRMRDLDYNVKKIGSIWFFLNTVLVSICVFAGQELSTVLDYPHTGDTERIFSFIGIVICLIFIGGVGIFNLIVIFSLIFASGTFGINRYGRQPVGMNFKSMFSPISAEELSRTEAPWRVQGETYDGLAPWRRNEESITQSAPVENVPPGTYKTVVNIPLHIKKWVLRLPIIIIGLFFLVMVITLLQ